MPISKRLLGLYNQATVEEIEKGLAWYYEANLYARQLASDYFVEPSVAASVISCLSPFVTWEANKKDAKRFLSGYHNGLDIMERVRVGTFNNNKRRAMLCLTNLDGVMTGKAPKTYAFYRNIMLDSRHVTIDRHAYKALVGKQRAGGESITLKRYRAAEATYKDTADSLGLKGYELQAIVWLVYKRLVNR